MLQLLTNLRSHSQAKEITDADILKWANKKVKSTGRTSHVDSFKDKNLSNGIFLLELLSSVEPRVVNWNIVTKGESDEEKKLNATYIISVARKLGCSIFLLPEDIMEVNQKMILTLTASIMYWCLQRQAEEPSTSPHSKTTISAATTPDASPAPSINGEDDTSVSLSFDEEDDSSLGSEVSPVSTIVNDGEVSELPIKSEYDSLAGEISKLVIDDRSSETIENEEASAVEDS